MATEQNSPEELLQPLCRRCGLPIDPARGQALLDRFGTFLRLRCNAPGCSHEDWYKSRTAPVAVSAGGPPAEPGEVWIHDVILGLSFRTSESTEVDIK